MQTGTAPITKNSLHILFARGMIPIAKNITVVDEQGNEYEATYPKRAKGLVKNGRARFIEENKICLQCPPNSKLEDCDMSDNTKAEKLSAECIFEQIVKTQGQLSDLKDTVYNITCVEEKDSVGEEVTTVHEEIAVKKIEAISEVFRCREESLHKLLELYGKMYMDLTASKS